MGIPNPTLLGSHVYPLKEGLLAIPILCGKFQVKTLKLQYLAIFVVLRTFQATSVENQLNRIMTTTILLRKKR